MKRLIFQTILMILDALGFNALFRRINRNKLRIIMYHGVTEQELHPAYWLHLHRQEFELQLEHLKKRYNVFPAEVLVDAEKNQESAAIITFDDGLANVHEIARPLLLQCGFPAICFVVPGLSEENSEIATETNFHIFMSTKSKAIDLEKFELGIYNFDDSLESREIAGINLNNKLKEESIKTTFEVRDYLVANYRSADDQPSPFKLMTVEQIKEFANSSGLSIGGHTFRHPALSSLSLDQQEEEIKLCMDKLNEWLDDVSPVFCYPSGKYTDDTVLLLKKHGIKAAVSTHENLHDPKGDSFRVNRISIGSQTSIWEFKAKMSGMFYSFFGKLGV